MSLSVIFNLKFNQIGREKNCGWHGIDDVRPGVIENVMRSLHKSSIYAQKETKVPDQAFIQVITILFLFWTIQKEF